ncbi:hypothetical protein MYX65_01700 [Acidobacteria bacterium AH-259-L09]|nr:hypothetical protein [Acidobacteria bacterium AH-259-L09]
MGDLTGIAIVNPTNEEALVTLKAYGDDGRLLVGNGFQNPVEIVIPPNQQISKLTSELFGGTLDPAVMGWFQATSPVDGLTGFFLFLNSSATLFDGADLPVAERRIVFNQVRLDSGYSTELNIVNPGSALADLQLVVVRPDLAPVSRRLDIPGKGVLRFDASLLFGSVEVPAGSYILVSSNVNVAGFEAVRMPDGDAFGLNALSASQQLTDLFFPQMVVLGPWKTELGLVNYSTRSVIVTVSAFQPDGSLYDQTHLKNNPVTRGLEPGKSLLEDVESMFGFSGEETLEGWILVESTSTAINGYLTYGIPETGSLAALPGSAQGLTRAVFSHLATAFGFFTGMAVLNPGELATDLRILAMKPSGEVLGLFDTVLQPRQRLSKLITELVPEASGQAGGLIWISADLPVHLTALFGTANILANISPQPAPESFLPDAGLPSLKVTPPLAIVQPNNSQTFQAEGAAQEAIVWRVNGAEGGNESVGTISLEGVYQAPPTVPSPQVVTISAEAIGRAGGASVDVLDKQTLFTSLSVVQSVAYLGSLERLYTAELALLGAARTNYPGANQNQTESTNSEIFELAPGAPKLSLASFEKERISKMIPFSAANGRELLLLAGQTTGRVIRLDPITRQIKDVVTGLNEPTSLAIDSVSGNLLVAEKDKITTVAKNQLEADLLPAARLTTKKRRPQKASIPAAPFGATVDACTGIIYFSVRGAGEIRAIIRQTGEIKVVAFGLSQPEQIAGFYRRGVSCPFSCFLLVVEAGLDRIVQVNPRNGFFTTFAPAEGTRDVIILPKNPFAPPGVLFNERVADVTELVVVANDANEVDASNTMMEGECIAEITFNDARLEAAVRDALGLEGAQPIPCAALEDLDVLDARGKDIEVIDGIQNIKNLVTLRLDDNSISSLGPVADLSLLRELTASNNQLESASLSNLKDLRFLGLSNNSITGELNVEGLTELVFVNVANNLIRSIRFEPSISLISLDVRNNMLRNLSSVAQLTRVDFLNGDSNLINTIQALAGSPDLHNLSLRNNRIVDIAPLEENGNFGTGDFVDVSGNPVDAVKACPIIERLSDGGATVVGVDCAALGLVEPDPDEASPGSSPPGPDLSIGLKYNAKKGVLLAEVFFRSGEDDKALGGPDEIAAKVFSIDYDEEHLKLETADFEGSFPPVDLDGDEMPDEIPDSISLTGAITFAIVSCDSEEKDGECDFAILEPPLGPDFEEKLLTIRFKVKGSGPARVRFSRDPEPSFGDVTAQSIKPGEIEGNELVIP